MVLTFPSFPEVLVRIRIQADPANSVALLPYTQSAEITLKKKKYWTVLLDPHDSIADPDLVGNKNNPVIFSVKSKNKMSFFCYLQCPLIFLVGVYRIYCIDPWTQRFSLVFYKLNETQWVEFGFI